MMSLLMTIGLVSHAGDVAPVDLLQQEAAEGINLTRLGDGTYEWSLPDGLTKTIRIPLGKLGIKLDDYDEIRFEMKPSGSQVSLHTLVTAFPAQGQFSTWYAKFPQAIGEWTEGRYDLRVDDDGAVTYLPKEQRECPDQVLQLTLSRRIIGFPGEPVWRKVQLRGFRFIRYRVAAQFDLLGADITSNANEVVCQYMLEVENRTDAPLAAKLDADSAHTLKHFTVSAPADIPLGPREKKRVPIRLAISRQRAGELPPLYAELLYPRVYLPDVPDSDVVPLMGYRRWAMWAVVPMVDWAPMRPANMQKMLEAWKASLPGVEEWKARLVQAADNALREDWPVPPLDLLPGGFDQAYRCSKCGSQPVPAAPGNFRKHTCPKCQTVMENNPEIDKPYVSRYLGKFAGAARTLALAYQVTGKDECADKAVVMLRDLARIYPDITVTRYRSTSGGSRLRLNTLHSSYTLPVLAEAYAYLGAAPSLTAEAKQQIEGFLRDEAFRIARHGSDYNNQGAEHFRAFGSVGLATGYGPLVALALYDKYNWYDMIEYGFAEDGTNPEGEAYHKAIFYAMNGFALFAHQYGLELLVPRFKRVYDATLAILGPEGCASYELAYRAYREPMYLPAVVAARKPAALGECTLFAGVPAIPDVQQARVQSQLLPESGFVFLRKGTVTDYWEARLNYIKSSQRSEADKLSTVFLHKGQPLDPHVGRITYAAPGSDWMYATAAQNAIVVDGTSQRPVDGRLIAFDPSPTAPIAVAATSPEVPLYEGVQQVRGVALIDEACIVFDRITTEKPRVIDRYQYGPGAPVLGFPSAAVETLPCLPTRGKFTGIAGGACGKEVRIAYGNALTTRVVSDQDLHAFSATTFGGYQAQPMPVTFVRANPDKEVTFLAALALGKDVEPPRLRIRESTPTRQVYEVESKGLTYTIVVDLANKRATVNTSR
jgi:hypothetical protein